jgi:hypothetical protein
VPSSVDPSPRAARLNADAPAPRLLCVCADDFGLHSGINAAVVELAHAGRISATSCMVKRGAWDAGAQALRRVGALQVDAGLHLDLTQPLPGRAGEPRLTGLLARSYLGLLGRAQVLREIRDQFARFEDGLGRPPAFVDGHRHVHQLPTVREVLVEEMSKRYGDSSPPWLRSTVPPRQHPRALGGIKAELIFALGGARLLACAAERSIPASGRLLGVYDFSGTAQDYRNRLERWVDECRSGDVLMCHPSQGCRGPDDPIDPARRNEYAVLLDFEFPHRTARGSVELGVL